MNFEELRKFKIYNDLFLAETGLTFNGHPLLLKEHIVKGFPLNFMTDSLKKAIENNEVEYTTTSGTTADRMQIIRKKNWWLDEYRRTYQFNSHLNKVVEEGRKKAILTICSNTVCYREDPTLEKRIINNTLYLNSTFDPWKWQKEDIERIIDELDYFEPYYIDADSVYLGIFLFLKEKYNIQKEIWQPQILTLSYEFVTKNLRKYISDYFSCEILNLYGTTEFGYAFLENSDNYMDLCCEQMTIEYDAVDEKKGIYALIINSWKNEYMPLFNYCVGDLVEIEEGVGGKKNIKRICGRSKDLTYSHDNTVITTTDIDDIIFKTLPRIFQYQLQFLSDDKILLKYITIDNHELHEIAAKNVVHELNLMYQKQIILSKENSIPPELSCKFTVIKKI